MVNLNIEEYLKKQILIAACLNIGHIMIGYSIGWSSPVTSKLKESDTSPFSFIVMSSEISWIGSCYILGIVIGPHISGPIANTIGRKLCLVMGGSLNLFAQFLICFAFNLPMIYAGRVISGIGLGMIAVNNVVFIGEIASPNIRGIILTSTGIFHTLGMLIAYAVGPLTSYAGMSYVHIGFSIAHLLSTFYLPESPMFYLIKGNEEKAKEVLTYLGRGKDIERELKIMSEDTQTKNFDWSEIFTIKSNRKSFIITIAMFIFQQCCGSLAVQSFATTIFESAGSSIKPDFATIVVGLTQFLGTLLVPTLIERAGRKTLLLISLAGCGINTTILGVYFYLKHTQYENLQSIGWLPLATLVLFVIFFSVGLNIIPNTLMGEMYRANARSVGSSISLTLGTLAGFGSLTSFNYIIEAIGSHYTFWIFSCINVIGLLFTLAVVPETKGLTLNEIDVMLSK